MAIKKTKTIDEFGNEEIKTYSEGETKNFKSNTKQIILNSMAKEVKKCKFCGTEVYVAHSKLIIEAILNDLKREKYITFNFPIEEMTRYLIKKMENGQC